MKPQRRFPFRSNRQDQAPEAATQVPSPLMIIPVKNSRMILNASAPRSLQPPLVKAPAFPVGVL
jgi:hypothetical protein